MIELEPTQSDGAKIRVIGIGGGGGNAINSMITLGLSGVDFIAANTDKQALDHNLAQVTIQIGAETTNGLGAGADPDIGKRSVEENAEEIREIINDSDMLFVTGGMGGGTGTGGAPIIAEIGQELGALVVGIVTKPFIWEGRKRMIVAEKGIEELRKHVDALIVIPNQKLLDIIDKDTTFGEAFRKVDEVLYNATRGIADIISKHGMVNVDFADVKTVMKGMGDALMGIGVASGEHRAVEATQDALNSPLLDGISISGAKGVLVNITGGSDMTMHEVTEAVSIVEKAAGENANLIHGVVYNQDAMDELMVTVVATGFKKDEDPEEVEQEEAVLNEPGIRTPGLFPDYKGPKFVPSKFPFSNDACFDAEEEDENEMAEREFTSSPKGHDELSKYDRPAYERRGKLPLIDFSDNEEQEENEEEPEMAAATEEPAPKSKGRPSFLRRIMD